ncbi:MAG: hypothetical protein V1725_07570 [archaeon]
MMKQLIVFLVLASIFLTACQTGQQKNESVVCPINGSTDPACALPQDNTTPVMEEETPDITEDVEISISEEIPGRNGEEVSTSVTGTEGDLIQLKPHAISPEGADITYEFSTPFNKNGLWQTKDGDAGKHLVTITASDGITAASESVLVEIKPSNKAPVIECPNEITVNEGETIKMDCNVYDIDGDEVIVSYSGFMTNPSYKTTYDDAGSYSVVIRASDKMHTTTTTVPVLIKNVNRAPVFETPLDDFTAQETDVVTLNVKAYDPDGDPITVTYGTPFDSQGVWKTKIGDAGTYQVSVVAADSELTTKETAQLTLKPINTAPVLKSIAPIVVREGEELVINAEAYDRENDDLVITYSGWLTNGKYDVKYTDAYPDGCGVPLCNATYIITVKASDGFLSDSVDVPITVVDTWRGPVFEPK